MTWFQTHTGKAFEYQNPQPEQIDLMDIAHALSQLCRFAGHTKRHFSVAEHCINCSFAPELTSPQERFTALMHDAVEAYIADIPQPLKLLLPQYKTLEEEINAAIAAKFKFPAGLTRRVKQVDLRMLATERLQVLASPAPQPWAAAVEAAEPYDINIQFMQPEGAERMFLERFWELNEQRKAK